MKTLTLVLANQLFEYHPALETDTDFVLVESKELCNRLNYHKFKLTYILTCLREYRDLLISKGQKVYYFELNQNLNFEDAIKKLVKEFSYTKLQFASISDKPIRKLIGKIIYNLKLESQELQSPSFLTTNLDFQKYLEHSKQKYLMNSFYIWQRKRLNIFLDQNKPKFGKWSFDSENRKKLPKNVTLPSSIWEFKSKNYQNVAQTISELYTNNPGYLDLQKSWLPINHKQAKQKLQEFLETRFRLFGNYEDALTNRDNFVFHSVLSPMLNNGLLTPSYVLQEVLNHVEKNNNLEDFYNSIEGFIRQIIGWREWMKLLYEFKYDENFRGLNFFKAQEKLPDYFYDLKDLPENIPLTLAIEKVSKLSWAHHIERLMILSNWMTLNSYNPKECYEWFLSQFVDAYEWVMVPNVYGMGLFADGGFFATKPYISGGAYIKKMSDYKDNGWIKLWTDRYWQFLKNNKSQLKDNPRMKLILSKI